MKIAIHSIIKDPYTPYLLEWLEYHREIGIDHFFIYDNDSAVPISSVVSGNDITIEVIHNTPITAVNAQLEAYNRFLLKLTSGELPYFDRIAFIDEDEFITCPNTDIKSVLSNYLSYPALALSWRIFGSSGLLHRTPESQVKKFTKYTGRYYESNINIKCIVNPYLVSKVTTPHSFEYHFGHCVNVHKIPIEYAFSYPVYDLIWINHYWTRSLDEFKEKALVRGMVGGKKRSMDMFEDVERNCTESI
jgi:hypothetical protein